ncbi:restriction endonuclease [Candidatus Woesearchaeota archaeon]|nr:restriction endonuclease [Candidatus Woesearchaeota archaeon]
MRVLGVYSFNNGEKFVKKHFPNELKEVKQVIGSIRADKYLTKESKEKTMKGEMLYSPVGLNDAFKKKFSALQWQNHKITCDYHTKFYVEGFQPAKTTNQPFRDMDFVKNKLGVEVQFGKYSFMVYNVCAKMTIFNKMGIINAGIEVVPIKELAMRMSTGVSYFEQFVWDLEHRGVSNIDIPVLILGIGK